MKPKVLFVDDETNVLNALKRQFRKQYDVTVAASGADALTVLQYEGPFAVIMSDMQMPEMNGVEFLQRAQQLCPDTVRLMLTGNADQQTAIDAVNKGNVFSFYMKPASPEIITAALIKAVQQYELVTAEKELLEGTLNGSIKLLLDMLSMIAPDSFGKTLAMQELGVKIAGAMGLDSHWHLKIATMMCNIASITLPAETLTRLHNGGPLSEQENEMIEKLPEVGRKLVSNIPRMESIAKIIQYQNKFFDGTGFPQDDISGNDIPLESRILHIVQDFENFKLQGMDEDTALGKLQQGRSTRYDPDLLDATAAIVDQEGTSRPNAPIESPLIALVPGYLLANDIETMEGKLVCSRGHEITESLMERLINYHTITPIREPILVLAPQSDAGDDLQEAV